MNTPTFDYYNDGDLPRIIYDEARQHERLTHQQVVELSRRIADGDHDALATLVTHNLKLVIHCIPHGYRDNLDCFQAGCIGLLVAARKYDPARGTQFSTYAVNWIRSHVQRERFRNRVVHVPVPVIESILQARRALDQRNLEQTPAAVNAITNIEQYVYSLILATENGHTSFEQPNEHLTSGVSDVLDTYIDHDQSSVEDTVELNSDVDTVLRVLKTLPQRKQEIWILTHAYSMSSRELSERYGLSKSRIQQIVTEVSLYIQCKLGVVSAAAGKSA